MNVYNTLAILFLLFLKHFIVDFVLQTDKQVRYKGIFGHPVGFAHSFEHGIWTAVILNFYTDITTAIVFAYIEVVIHYLTDFCKMRYGCQDISQKMFWVHLGLDQFVHYLTYLAIVVCL